MSGTRRHSRRCPRARTRASTTAPVTTGRTPSAGRNRLAPGLAQRAAARGHTATRPPWRPTTRSRRSDATGHGRAGRARFGMSTRPRQSILASATDVLAGDDLFVTPGWNPFAPGPAAERATDRRASPASSHCWTADGASSAPTPASPTWAMSPSRTPSSAPCPRIHGRNASGSCTRSCPSRAAAGRHHLYRHDV